MATVEGLLTEFQIHFQPSESLIHRARDRAAGFFMEHGFDKLITIDADIEWSYEDFKRLITSDKDIIGGLYPLKAFPVVMNFNPLPGQGSEFFKTGRGIDYDAFQEFKAKYADEQGLAEVRHIATGFLCVTRAVFESLKTKSKVYATYDSVSGEMEAFVHYYESGVHEGQLESEDWSFIRRAREAGFKAYIDTRVTLGHVGIHTYRLGQFFGQA
jgi:hypothetical protein